MLLKNFFRFSLALALCSPATALAFNWNKETVKSFIHNRGKMEAPRTLGENGRRDVHPGGHNLATRRGMDLAILKASSDPALKKAMEAVYGETLDNMKGQDGFTFQKILWGNFSNEIQTMLDAGEGSEKLAGWYMSASYSRRTNITGPDGRHSKYWRKETGHSSSNAIHSMLVSSTGADAASYTQDHSMQLVRKFALFQLETAIANLAHVVRAERDGIYVLEESYFQSAQAALRFLRTIRKAYVGDNSHYVDSRFEFALRDLGSIFHTIQDSAVACTDAAKTAAVDPAKNCVAGDGHSVVEKVNGKWKIVSLSDQAWYVRKDGQHHQLDNLYQPGNLASVEELAQGSEKGVYGSFDPALPVGEILLEVAQEVESINDKLARVPAYTTLSSKDLTIVGLVMKGVTGKQMARENSLSAEWNGEVTRAARSAAQRIAEKHIFSRYATRLRPMPPPPTHAGPAAPHGSER